jgi:sec-independent protein translocase protein TatA
VSSVGYDVRRDASKNCTAFGGIMFGLGLMELGIIALILLLLFGAKRIPLLMGSIGQGIREFKHSFRDEAPDTAKLEDKPRS